MDGATFIVEAKQWIGIKEKCEASETIVNMWLRFCASKHDMRNMPCKQTRLDEATCSHCLFTTSNPLRIWHAYKHPPRPRATVQSCRGGYSWTKKIKSWKLNYRRTRFRKITKRTKNQKYFFKKADSLVSKSKPKNKLNFFFLPTRGVWGPGQLHEIYNRKHFITNE